MRLNTGKLQELDAAATKLMEEAKAEGAQVAINAFNAAQTAIRDHNQNLQTQVQRMMEELNNARERDGNGMAGGVSPMVIPTSNPATAEMGGLTATRPNGGMGM